MNKRKLWALLLALVLVVSVIPIQSVFAATTATLGIWADKKVANPGDTINFTVEIEQTGGIGGWEFFVELPEGLSLVDSSLKAGELENLSAYLDKQSDGAIKGTGFYNTGICGEGETSTHTLATFSATVDEDAEFKNYDVEFKDGCYVVDHTATGKAAISTYACSVAVGPVIVASDVKAAPGGNAYVTIGLLNNPGIASMSLDMSFDTDVLTLIEVNDAGVLGDTAHKPELVNPYTLVWANDEATEDFTITGTIVTLVFKVADDAQMGDVTPIEITYDYDQYGIMDAVGNKVRFATANGSVTVAQSGPNAIGDFEYTTSGTELTITGYTGASKEVEIGSKYTVGGVEYTVTEIGYEAFIDNEDIISVVIPETVKTIGEAAFYNCLSLLEVTILSEDASIGEVALGYYTSGRKEYVVEGFTIKGYEGSTAEQYAAAVEEITFVKLPCKHTGGTATCKDQAVCENCGEPYGEKDPANHAGGTEIRDAVKETCNDPGYTGDTWCLGCNTKIEDGKAIDPTGDHVDVDGEWESNGTQHFHTCKCGTEFDHANHTGGEATCKDQAACSVCQALYGETDPSNHKGDTYLVGQKETSCYEEGYTGDIYCNDCDVKIEDGESIPMSSHNPASVWTTDETHHWKQCETVGCGNLIEKAVHTGGEATCKKQAICSVCQVPYGNLDDSNHKNTEIRDAVKETCNDPGYTGDTWCTDCETKIEDGKAIDPTGDHIDVDGEWESNGTQHFHTCKCGTKFNYTDHTGGTATCKDVAVCTTCGTSYGEKNPANHAGGTENRDAVKETCNDPGYTGDTWCLGCNTKIEDGKVIDPTGDHIDVDGAWESNGTQHFHTCKCGTEFDHENHKGGEATCKDKAVCSVCQTSYGEKNPSNHKGDTYVLDQKETSCYEEGYTGDTYCNDCDVKIKDGEKIPTSTHNPASVWSTDETHHWKECETVGCGNLIDKAVHTGGEATCTKQAICSVCQVPYGNLDTNNHKNTEIRDAVKETCNDPGYSGDTWCKDCETKIADGKVIDPTGDHVDANDKWESNGTQHFHTCGCGTEFDHASHTGGEATCKNQAACSVCQTLYGETNPSNHKGETYLVGQKETSCYEEGYTGDTYCKDCDVKIQDGEKIPTSAHIPASVWSTDETHHWKECETVGCGNLIDKDVHKGGEATCKKQAICSVCQVPYGALDANNHKNTEIRDAVKETCNEPGYTGDTWCKDCETKIADGKVIDPTGDHVDANGKWESNGTQHFHTCGCGTEFDHANHAGGEATCKDRAVCSTCQVSYGETNPSNHKGDTYLVGDKKTTCKEEGYTGDTYCKDCDVKLSDGETIDKVPHIVNEWTISKEATVEELGKKSGTCVECKDVLTVDTAKLVSEIKADNVEGIKAEVEAVGDTNISEDVYFVAKEVQNSMDVTEKTNIENAIKESITSEKNFKFAAIFDLKLILRESDKNGDPIAETELELNGTVKVTIPVPTEVLEKLTDVKLVHVKDNGEVELIPFSLANGKATFEAKEFSYYTFIGTEKVSTSDSNVGETNSPQTGDYVNMFLWIALLFVSGTCFTAYVVYKKRTKQSR